METLHLYGNRIGLIEFECLRHKTIHEAYLKVVDGKMETTCPICFRRYIMNDQNRFYSDRPLRVIEVDIDMTILNKFITSYNQVEEAF